MAAAIITRGILALFVAGALLMVLTPVIYGMKVNESMWNGTSLPPEAYTTRDHVYSVFEYAALICMGSGGLWMIVNAARRDPQEY